MSESSRVLPRTGEVAVAPLPPSQLPAAVEVLARAFRDNPLNRAVARRRGPRRRQRMNEYGMRGHLPVACAQGRVLGAQHEGGLAGVLIAALPWGYPFPPLPVGVRLRSLLGQGLGVATRWARVYEALDARHPRDEHWYLATLGVAPELQRHGVGSALLERWLAEVDRDRLPAWLETDREENLGFYGRFGFEAEHQIEVLGTPVWGMRRPPSGSDTSEKRGSTGRPSG